MFKTFTFVLFAALVVVGLWALISLLFFHGGPSGAGWVAGIALGLAAIVAVLSRVLNGAWFTDRANGR